MSLNSEIVRIFYEFLGDKSLVTQEQDFYENLGSQEVASFKFIYNKVN